MEECFISILLAKVDEEEDDDDDDEENFLGSNCKPARVDHCNS